MTERQQTLARAIELQGIGLHSGLAVRMRILPAAPNAGIQFRRMDMAGQPILTARFDRVRDMTLCTALEQDGLRIATIEHLMAAFAGMGVDNALVEVDAPELPVMDGSSRAFVAAIEQAGLAAQDAARRYIRVLRTVTVMDGDKMAQLSPAPEFSIEFAIDFADPAIGRQNYLFTLESGAFARELAAARTFGFLHEVEAMHARGLARGGSLDNAVVFDQGRVVNPEGLRFADECVRHKILDALGDLYLAGAPILGAFSARKSGHALNNQLLRALLADRTAWEWAERPLMAGAPHFIPATAAAASL